jgi:XTP/dITP diphosphohydrolase
MILILATGNQGKVREIVTGLALPSLSYKSLNDFSGLPEIIEDGLSFLENALIKARTISRLLGLPVLADDSGLEVDFLKSQPGIYSARFAGPEATDRANNEKLLSLMREVPDEQRTARFVCVMVLTLPSGEWLQAEGVCRGLISRSPLGDQGFGYDPVFYLPDFQKTMAQLPLGTKNKISHRARALEKIRPRLAAIMENLG